MEALLKATEEGRVEWEELGLDGFVAQPGKLAVTIEGKNAFSELLGEQYTSKVTSNAGNIVDSISSISTDGALFHCMKSLHQAAQRDIENRIGENLDELVESLRA